VNPGQGGGLAADVQAWVDANWDRSITVRAWWRRLADAGYAYPSWPEGLGGSGASRGDAATISGVLAQNRVIGPPVGAMAARLAAPTILQHATEALQRELVRAIATGEAAWCQLFSEP
jgi:alkylation response protein AidB-like acyl-CoA dehydrogenase